MSNWYNAIRKPVAVKEKKIGISRFSEEPLTECCTAPFEPEPTNGMGRCSKCKEHATEQKEN